MTVMDLVDLSGDGRVVKEIINIGVGTQKPLKGCTARINYTGRLIDGKVFDTTEGRQQFEFELGKGCVIKGFEMGVASMTLQEKCKVTCYPDYAYGVDGNPPSIPPNATLIFEMELLGWRGEDVSPEGNGSIERVILETTERKRTPSDGSLVKIHLIGEYDGKIFDEREVEFHYGEGSSCRIVEGVEIGLGKMKVGETSKLKIRSKYAFGEQGNSDFNIPANATVEYTIKLINCEKGIEEWSLTEADKIVHANLWKEKGTKYFSENNYELALKMYKKGLSFLNKDYSEPQSDMVKLAAYNNISLCYQKLNNPYEAKNACNKALVLDPNNIKALFRRGQCNLDISEFDEAMADFKKVIELNPDNKAAHNRIVICTQKIKESLKRERRLYGGMFTKFAAGDRTPPPIEPDVLEKCGEWTDEDAKREVDLAFERDNNIVMI